MDLSFLLKFVDAGKLGGWVRGVVASLLVVAIARWPALSSFLSPEAQTAIGVIVSSLVIGLWSHLAKWLQDHPDALKAAAPAVKSLILPLAIAAALSALYYPAPAHAQWLGTATSAAPVKHAHKAKVQAAAQASPATTSDAGGGGSGTGTPGGTQLTAAQVQQNPLVLLQQIATTDLQAALADANAQTPPDTTGANCYQALITLKSNPAFALPSGAVPGVFTAVQKARDLKTQLANIAAPNGPLSQLNQGCAAWTQDNVATFIAIGGMVGLIASPAGATATASAAIATLPAQIAAFLAAIPK